MQHGVWYELSEVVPTAVVKIRLVKFLADAGFISSKVSRDAVASKRTHEII
jgi:hypothetical protein